MPPAVTSILEPHVERPVAYTPLHPGLSACMSSLCQMVDITIVMKLCGIFPHALKGVGSFTEKNQHCQFSCFLLHLVWL